jgi:hypothetical protein
VEVERQGATSDNNVKYRIIVVIVFFIFFPFQHLWYMRFMMAAQAGASMADLDLLFFFGHWSAPAVCLLRLKFTFHTLLPRF